MIRADRPLKANVIKRLHNLIHIEAAVGGKVSRFLKIPGEIMLQVPHMGEMNASLQSTDHARQVVLRISAVRPRAEGHAVVGVVHHLHHALKVGQAGDDPGQAEYAPSRVIRVDSHADIVSVTNRHNSFQEIFQVGEKLFLVHILIKGKELLDFRHTLRLPARHHISVGIPRDGIKHFFRIQSVDGLLAVGQNGGTVRPDAGQLRAGPVENGHEIIAHHMDILFAQVFQGADIVFDVTVPFRKSDFNGIVDVHTFDTRNMKPAGLHFLLQCMYSLLLPKVSGSRIVKSGDHARHTRDLADLLQRDRIEAAAVPAQCHFH